MKLRKYLNMHPVLQMLLIAWVSYTMAHPKTPTTNYVILVLFGGQGTGKSTLCKILQTLIDPSRIGIQTLPSNGRDLAISLQHAHLRCFDNVRSILNILSDFLCIASTGGTLSSRKLYTDAEEQAIYLHGAVVINTIHQLIDQSDQAQRCLKLELDKIDETVRKRETSIFDDFQADLPHIMRELFERIAMIFKHLPDATITHPERMIEFVHWLAAMEKVDDAPEGAYQAEYSRLLNEGQLDTLMDNSLAAATVELAEKIHGKQWTGTPAELLRELEAFTNQRTQRSREWPLNPIALSKRLRSLQAGLLTQGISVEFTRENIAPSPLLFAEVEMTTEIFMVLDGGFIVPKPFYDRIMHEILDVIHVLQPGVEYTAEMLCGPDLWGPLKGGEPSLAGRCVMDMVLKGVLPLQVVGGRCLHPKRYTLKRTN